MVGKIIDGFNEMVFGAVIKGMVVLGVYSVWKLVLEIGLMCVPIFAVVLLASWIAASPERKTKAIPIVSIPASKADPTIKVNLEGGQ